MKNCIAGWLHLMIVFSLVVAPSVQAANDADAIYMGGTIYTMTESYDEAMDDSNAKKVESVATKDGKVVFTGSWADAQAQYKGANTRIVDLKGKTMLPGFVDPHSHFPGQGSNDLYDVNLNSPPLGTMTSIADYIDALKARAAVTAPGEWIIGWGYDDTLIKEMRHPTAAELDQASTQHPIYISHISAHMAVANTMAMELNDIKNNPNYETEVAAGNVPLNANGNPTGFLRETKAMSLISRPGKTAEQTNRGLHRGAETYLAHGLTTGDNGAAFLSGGAGDPITQYQELMLRGTLPLRMVVHPLGRYGKPDYAPVVRQALGWSGTDTVNGIEFPNGVPGPNTPGTGDDISNYRRAGAILPEGRIWLGNWKIIFDGSNQGYTGWFKTPGYYIAPEGSGREYHSFEALNFTPEEMAATLKLLHKNNEGVEIHGNGNAAIEQIITAIEESVAEYPHIKNRRHTIIHSQMAERQHVERMMGNYDNLKPELASMYGYPPDDGLVDNAYMLTGTYLDGQRNADLISRLNNGQLMKEQNLVNSYYVAHTYFWGDRHRDIFMGPGRGKNISPSQWSIYNHNVFNYHSDTPVVPMEPLRSLQAGVSRVSSNGNGIYHTGKDYHGTINLPETEGGALKPFWDYDQRANRLMALRALTVSSAFPTFLEDKVGVIKPSAYADFVILDKDPMTTPELELAALRIAATIAGDKVAYGYLPGADDYTGGLFGSYIQPDDTSVVVVSQHTTYTKDEARNTGYTLPEGNVFYTIKDFDGTVSGGTSSAVLQFLVFGNGKSASSFTLHGLNGDGAYAYGRPTPGSFENSDGVWWLAPIDEPNLVVAPGDTLENLGAYIAYFVVRDNGEFDKNNASGLIAGAIALTADATPDDGTAKRSGGGSSGGCSVGGDSFGLELLLAFAALSVLLMRRRMTQQQ